MVKHTGKMHIGMVGLGRMGMNMALRLVRDGHTVTAYNRSPAKTREAEEEGVRGAYTLKDLALDLPVPRVVWLMLPAGEPVDAAIAELKAYMREGDVIVDGGNGFYKDDIRRSAELGPLGISYLDVGVSGGVWGLKDGYCLMAGGDRGAFEALRPVLTSLAQAGGLLWCGPPGAGHFVKMAHNAIEYGMMEAYGEGFELLRSSRYGEALDLAEVAALWMRGSVVRSWLLDLLEGELRRDKDLASISGHVEDSGEGRWSVKEAVDSGVSMPAITESLFRRFRSRQEDPFAEKVMAALRNSFGGHAVRKKA
jgi:6-phosphogluconate dehydrogenase